VAERSRVRPVSAEEATRDLVEHLRGGGVYWAAIVVLAVLAVAGTVALGRLVASGPQPYAKWGYTAAVVAFLISTFQAAPVVTFTSRLGKGFWGIPLRRAAELGTLASLVTMPLLIVLLFQLPDFQGRPSIWFDWPGGPRLWDAVAIVVFAVLGLGLLFLSSLPDLAAARDARPRGLFRRLSLGWRGTTRQWQVLSAGVVVLGAFYLMLFVFVNLLVVSDLALSLVPGWHSAVMPPYHALSGLEAGVATTLLLLAGLRRFGGLERYIGLDPFWAAAKLLLPLTLLFFYFTWAELLTNWYGRLPDEQQVFSLFMFGPYLWPFVLSFGLNFVVPFLLLIWNPIRVSIAGPTAVAALVVIGSLVDRVRIYVPAWSIAGPVTETIDQLPPFQPPELSDFLIVLGAVALVGLLYLLAMRLFLPVSLWEYKQGVLLSRERAFVKTELTVLAKPR
jgi:molybdopterin-containing oxidoreductase family membrane subunit